LALPREDEDEKPKLDDPRKSIRRKSISEIMYNTRKWRVADNTLE
jgi:hypothetical protein